ncbi:uncharacterized protein [Dermacentor albipictus]|uniref:uncharacterized protein n=1 Tax=Dermacentor albipictus TaxID=60249 RepID=UPI0031FBC4ED
MFAMGVGNLHAQWMLAVLLFAASTDASDSPRLCNVTQVQECYNGILARFLNDFTRGPLNASKLETLCKEHDVESLCNNDLQPCSDTHPALADMEKLYNAIYEDACNDTNFKLLKSFVPMRGCAPLPLIETCLQEKMKEFQMSIDDAKSSCNGLGAALTSCLIAPGLSCLKNRKRPTYAKKTMKALVESTGCNPNDGNPFVQGDQQPPTRPNGDGNTCSYKQLKRCHEKQINDIRTTMSKILAKGLLPDDDFSGAICRKKRETCYQHNKIEPCPEHERDAIRRLEESMNEAQQLLCQGDRALLKNLLLTYKWWKVGDFIKCSTNVQVNYITDYLYATARLHNDCSMLRTRLTRCLNESYSSAEQADPKPDVDGARKVLATFLDRMWCVDQQDLPQGPGGDEVSGSMGNGGDDDDDPTDEPAITGTQTTTIETAGSAIPVVSGDPDNGVASQTLIMPVLAGLVSAVLLLPVFSL